MKRNTQREQAILQAMMEEARRCGAAGMTLRETVQAVRQVKRELLRAYRLGLIILPAPEAEQHKP